jgi:hypothetical protein
MSKTNKEKVLKVNSRVAKLRTKSNCPLIKKKRTKP